MTTILLFFNGEAVLNWFLNTSSGGAVSVFLTGVAVWNIRGAIFWYKDRMKNVVVKNRDLSKQITIVDDRVTKLEETVGEGFVNLKGEIGHRLKQVDERIFKLEETIEYRFAKVDDRFEKVDDRLEKIDDRFEKVDDRLIKLEEKVDDRLIKLEEKFDDRFVKLEEQFDDRFIKLEEKFDDRFVKLEEKVDDKILQTEIRIMKHVDHRFNESEKHNNIRFDHLQGQINSLEATTKDRFNEMAKRFDDLTSLIIQQNKKSQD